MTKIPKEFCATCFRCGKDIDLREKHICIIEATKQVDGEESKVSEENVIGFRHINCDLVVEGILAGLEPPTNIDTLTPARAKMIGDYRVKIITALRDTSPRWPEYDKLIKLEKKETRKVLDCLTSNSIH